MAENNRELDIREFKELPSILMSVDRLVKKNYLEELRDYDIEEIPEHIKDFSIRKSIRLLKIKKIVYDKNEEISDKLTTVYNSVLNNNTSTVMVIDSDGVNTDVYIGVKESDKEKNISTAKETLNKSIMGNFPGIELENVDNELIKGISEKFKKDYISSVTGVPSLKSEETEKFSQGLEKVIEGMRGEVFTAVFIADPISFEQLEIIKSGYESLYSQLYPFAETELSFGENESYAVTEGITKGITIGISKSISDSMSTAEGSTDGLTKTKNLGGAAASTGAFVGSMIGISGGPIGMLAGGAIGGAVGGIVGGLIGSESKSTTKSLTTTKTQTKTDGTTVTESEQANSSFTNTNGTSKQMQIKFASKSIQELLKHIDEQLERIKESENYGMWNCGAYFISNSYNTSIVAANQFKAIVRGNASNLEKSFVNIWDKDDNNARLVKDYISRFHHPLVKMEMLGEYKLPSITPTSMISGKELSIFCGLPRKSVSGIPVIEMAEFGRNVTTYDKIENKKLINIGRIFNMGRQDLENINIDIESLTGHTFITGSTGAGKSNAVYNILEKLSNQEIKFLVIEPAKGEYKNIFGGRDGVKVLGTNPEYAEMLRINPFIFENKIHVLEHIDRLIEILNAVWSMYAAMPAILKEAVERMYIEKGWDLETSLNDNKEKEFPTFKDLAQILPQIIKESAYSEELKGNYTGALVTRVNSLCTGLYGLIFRGKEIESKLLFDENCIIDLSRIGSSETKAMLMGILFMRLQEYRISKSKGHNAKLKHITVLEEAHNLMRRTSAEQSQEGANLQGKAVEMIANSIAEMRTYGEGFIIADQSPGLLDQSAIRNTNTKIIFRLPDEEDRKLVGKAANLNEDQIIELAKLKTGIAAIYQNNWIAPVLCQFEKFDNEQEYNYKFNLQEKIRVDKEIKSKIIIALLNTRVSEEKKIEQTEADTKEIKKWLEESLIPNSIIKKVIKILEKEDKEIIKDEKFEEYSQIIYEIANGDKIMSLQNKNAKDFADWNTKNIENINRYFDLKGKKEFEYALLQCILRRKVELENSYKEFYFSWVEDIKKRGVV